MENEVRAHEWSWIEMRKARYRKILEAIPKSEWDEFFPNSAKPWTPTDVDYLLDWYGRDDTLSLAYALGRTPWSVSEMARKLGIVERKCGLEERHA